MTIPVAAGRSGRSQFDRPILIVSTPRSGSTLLFETMAGAPGLFTTGDESHLLIERVPGLSPHEREWDSNRLTSEDATPGRAEVLSRAFLARLRDRSGLPPSGPMRMLEKTPKNALRVPFFNAVWPDALFVYLYRDVREALASMMEAWNSGGFRTYVRLPGWNGPPWSLLLVPGWRELGGLPLHEIVAHQWAVTTNLLLDDLSALPESRLRAVRYSDLLGSPQSTVARLATSLDLDWDRELGPDLPLSRMTMSRPHTGKWRKFESEIGEVWPVVEQADARAQAFLARIEGAAGMARSPG